MALKLRSKGVFRHRSITERAIRKERRTRRMRWGTVLFMLAVLMLGGLVALYIWYNSQQTQHGTVEAPPVENSTPTIGRPMPAANARVGVSIQMLTSPVAPGDNASVTIRTNPNITCTIVVEYNEVKAEDSGLTKKIADEFGVASWSWTVDDQAPNGTWPVTITCKNAKNSGVVKGSLKVAPATKTSSSN